MKSKKIILRATALAVACIALLGCRPSAAEKKPEGKVDVVDWVPARDWTTTVSNKVYRLEFGFRADGMILWRRGDAL